MRPEKLLATYIHSVRMEDLIEGGTGFDVSAEKAHMFHYRKLNLRESEVYKNKSIPVERRLLHFADIIERRVQQGLKRFSVNIT